MLRILIHLLILVLFFACKSQKVVESNKIETENQKSEIMVETIPADLAAPFPPRPKQRRAEIPKKQIPYSSQRIERFRDILNELEESSNEKDNPILRLTRNAIAVMDSSQDVRLAFRLLQAAKEKDADNPEFARLMKEFIPHLAFSFPNSDYYSESFETDGKYVFLQQFPRWKKLVA